MALTFAFIVHPIDPKKDVARKFPRLARWLPTWAIHWLSAYFPPVYLSRIQGVQSQATGEEALGFFVACPLTARRMRTLPVERVYRKIIQTGRLAQRLGAQLLGLGAFTSAIGDAGITVAQHLDIPVTTGDSYTVAATVELARQVAQVFGVALEDVPVAVVGATGSIGRGAALALAAQVRHLTLLARRAKALQTVAEEVRHINPQVHIRLETHLHALSAVPLVITATSAPYAFLTPEHLHPGTVVIDVALPRDATRELARNPDYLVLDGGLIHVPGPVEYGFSFGLPYPLAYACMAETMILALENRQECYTLGKRIQPEQVEQMQRWAQRHGFRLARWYSFGRPVDEARRQAMAALWRTRLGHRHNQLLYS